jgi:sugar/nucleoside kinase (ribokinase family)
MGALCEDIVVTPEYSRRGIGGSSYYFSAAFSGLGGRVGCVARTNLEWMLKELADAGIETGGVRQGPSTSFELSYQGGERSLRLLRHSSTVGADDIPEPMLGFDGLHLGPIEGELDLGSLVDLRSSFRLVSLDVQGLARTFDGETGAVGMATGMGPEVRQALQYADIVKFSQKEGERLLGERVEWAGRASGLQALGTPTIIVTLGRDGAIVFEDGEDLDIPAYPSEPVDWTGAGDAFMAGFVFQRLQGHGSFDAANFASALAAIVIERPRPLTFPGADDVLDRVTRGPCTCTSYIEGAPKSCRCSDGQHEPSNGEPGKAVHHPGTR